MIWWCKWNYRTGEGENDRKSILTFKSSLILVLKYSYSILMMKILFNYVFYYAAYQHLFVVDRSKLLINLYINMLWSCQLVNNPSCNIFYPLDDGDYSIIFVLVYYAILWWYSSQKAYAWSWNGVIDIFVAEQEDQEAYTSKDNCNSDAI